MKDSRLKSGKHRSLIRQPTLHQATILEANKQGIQVATGDGILNLLSLQPAGKESDERARPPGILVGNGLFRATVLPDSPLFQARSCRAFLRR
ncbi:hypothetical protein ACLB1E_09420 [Escherichia coli]